MEIELGKTHVTSSTKPVGDSSAGSSSDVETGTIEVVSDGVANAGYARRLTKRQVMMMTFGAGIGTGLWVGTGVALRYAGPGGIAVAYTLVAFIIWNLFMSIGEMTTYRPVHGGFIRQTADFVDPTLGFAIGLNAWFSWVMIIPAEITACISVLKFWPGSDAIPMGAYITIFLVVTAIPNLFPVKWYGHVEFALSWIKLMGIIACIFFMFIMASGGLAPTDGPLVFQYWKNPGAFHNGMKGIAKAFTQAAFSFGSAMHIAIIAGEVVNPRRTIKATIYPIFYRMFLFFVFNIWLVGMCVPYNDSRLDNDGTLGSPFVIAIERGGAMWFAHLINGFIIVTVVSCGVTSFYISSRNLCSLSDLGLIHTAFGKKDSRGRPWLSLTICTVLGGGLCFLNLNNTALEVYNWFSSLVAVAAFNEWVTILITHICFRRAVDKQGIGCKSLPFRAPYAPYMQYAALVCVIFVVACEFYLAVSPLDAKPSATAFFSVELALPLYFVQYFGYKWWYKTKIIKPEAVDLSEAKLFDTEDRLLAEREAEAGIKRKRWDPVQTVKNLILG